MGGRIDAEITRGVDFESNQMRLWRYERCHGAAFSGELDPPHRFERLIGQ